MKDDADPKFISPTGKNAVRHRRDHQLHSFQSSPAKSVIPFLSLTTFIPSTHNDAKLVDAFVVSMETHNKRGKVDIHF